MVEKITISVNSLCLMILASSVGGILIGSFIVRTYVKRRGSKTKSQKELTKLAIWIKVHHPEVVDANGTVVDKAIQLISQNEPKEQLTTL